MNATLSPSSKQPYDLSSLSRAIDPDWITRVLAATGKASIRRRKLPAEQVVWLVIALALYRGQSIPEVTAYLDLVLPDELNPDIAKSTLTQSRQRLGDEPLAQLFGLSAAAWDDRKRLANPLSPVPEFSGRRSLSPPAMRQ